MVTTDLQAPILTASHSDFKRLRVRPVNRSRIICFLFAAVALQAIFSILELNLERGLGRRGPLIWLISGPAWVLIVLCIWKFNGYIATHCSRLGYCLGKISKAHWLVGWVLTGAVLRLIWMVVYPAPQQSDFAEYFELTRNLLGSHRYGSLHLGLAFWPPGYPLFLYTQFLIYGIHSWVPAIGNFLLFLFAMVSVERIARRVVGAGAGRLAEFLLLFWPAFIMCGWLASKELLVLTLLLLSLLAYFNSIADKHGKPQIAWMFLAGALVGFAGLAQPSFILFPIVFSTSDWIRRESFVRLIARAALSISAMVVVILPWTIRNHRVLGEWVLISTNGGSVFYRANNDLATGAFIQSGGQEFDQLNEVQKSKFGYKAGAIWVWQHPTRFLALALRKQILFLGDDSTGAYETLMRGRATGGIRYFFWKGVSNIYWLAIWLLLFAGLAIDWNRPISARPELAVLMVSVIYLYSIHSVFESNGKYHLPLLGLLAVIASMVV